MVRAPKALRIEELPLGLHRNQAFSLFQTQSTLQPRGPYSEEELRKLYPERLELQLVQIVSLACLDI